MNQPTPHPPARRRPPDVAELRLHLVRRASGVRDQVVAAAAEAGLVPATDWELRTPRDPAGVRAHPLAYPLLSGLLPDAADVGGYAALWRTHTYPDPDHPWIATRTVIDGVGVEVWGLRHATGVEGDAR